MTPELAACREPTTQREAAGRRKTDAERIEVLAANDELRVEIERLRTQLACVEAYDPRIDDQRVEIERLREGNEALRGGLSIAIQVCDRQKAEIARLHALIKEGHTHEWAAVGKHSAVCDECGARQFTWPPAPACAFRTKYKYEDPMLVDHVLWCTTHDRHAICCRPHHGDEHD